jgi:very-short-patch-repair endonuclease
MNKYKTRKFKCIGCGKEVELRRAENKTNYCSINCYRSSKRPNRKTGKEICCEYCGASVYKPKGQLKKNNFCSTDCANKWQGRNKIEFICKVCGEKFTWSKSRGEAKYCSIECRNKSEDWKINACIQGNLVQQNKKGLNKLELAGRKILQNLGIKFNEQVLMFNKFLVDVLIKDKPIIIQWDGEYWHNKPKRKQLDESQDAYLNKCGYKVLRFTDREIRNNRQKVYDNIQRAIQ